MKKRLFFIFCLTVGALNEGAARTRYVAYNDISYTTETYDSLGRVSYGHLSTHENHLTVNIGDLQVTTYSIPVSDQENRAIKDAKASANLATAAMIASVASTVVDIATPHHHRHPWWYRDNRLLLDGLGMVYSASLHDKAVAALNEIKHFDGVAITISNNSLDIKSVIVNNIQYYIGPKDTKAFSLTKDGAVIIIRGPHGRITKVIANATRTVKKIHYVFADDELYYRKAKIDGDVIYQGIPKNNIGNPRYIDKETYEGLRKRH